MIFLVLVLTRVSCSIKVLWGEKGICCILFRIVVRLEVRDELRVLKVLIKMRVFPQMYMGFLEIPCSFRS